MHELIVLGSECAVSDQYMDLIIEAANDSGFQYTIRKIEDADEIERWGVSQGCLLGYCPGCKSIAAENPDRMFTPALVVDGIIRMHSGYHGIEEIRKIWKSM